MFQPSVWMLGRLNSASWRCWVRNEHVTQNEEVWRKRCNLKNKSKWKEACFDSCAIDLHACSFSCEEEKLTSAAYSQQQLGLSDLPSQILLQKQVEVGGKHTIMLKIPFKTAKYCQVYSGFDLSYSVPLTFSLLQNSSCLASALKFLEAIVFFIHELFLQEEQIDYLKNKSSSPSFSQVWKDNGDTVYLLSTFAQCNFFSKYSLMGSPKNLSLCFGNSCV